MPSNLPSQPTSAPIYLHFHKNMSRIWKHKKMMSEISFMQMTIYVNKIWGLITLTLGAGILVHTKTVLSWQ